MIVYYFYQMDAFQTELDNSHLDGVQNELTTPNLETRSLPIKAGTFCEYGSIFLFKENLVWVSLKFLNHCSHAFFH